MLQETKQCLYAEKGAKCLFYGKDNLTTEKEGHVRTPCASEPVIYTVLATCGPGGRDWTAGSLGPGPGSLPPPGHRSPTRPPGAPAHADPHSPPHPCSSVSREAGWEPEIHADPIRALRRHFVR